MKKTIKILAATMIIVVFSMTLVSCGGPNTDPDKALEALKENGINLATKDDKAMPLVLKGLGIDDVECVVSGTGKIDDEYAHITIIYFEEAEDAKDEWEAVKKYAVEDKEEEVKDSEWVCKKSGNMIYFGTKNAIAAAK